MPTTTETARPAPTGTSLIAGREVCGEAGTFAAVDPRDGAERAPRYGTLSTAQVREAVAAAVEARRQPLDREVWARALDHAAEAFESQADAVVAIADAETALGEGRLSGELARTVGQLRMMAEEARIGRRREVVEDPAGEGPAAPALRRTTIPLGVVAVFAASNFPLAFGVAGTDLAAAWGAGCPVVAKAHPAQPGTAELCGRILAAAAAAAGLHPGAISVLHDGGHEVGAALVTDDGVDAVAFTGSPAGGRALHDLAARRARPIPVYAEMGSLNPLVVSPGAAAARADELVEGIVGSFLLGEGQFCTKPGLVVLPDDDAGRAVLDGLTAAVRDRRPAHPLLHAGIRDGLEAGLAAARAVDGVVEVTGPADDGCPAVLLHAPAAAVVAEPALRAEIFGPAVVVVLADEAALADVLDALEPALTATLHAEPHETGWVRAHADRLARAAGRVILNGYPTGVRVSPAQHHGGPFPATTSPLHTSVGLASVDRFQRPVAFQSFPADALPGWA